MQLSMNKISDKEILAYARGFIDLFIYYNQETLGIRETCVDVLIKVVKYHAPQCTTEMIASQNDIIQKLNLYKLMATEIQNSLDFKNQLNKQIKDMLKSL